MKGQKRIRDYGIKIGELEPGKLNAITDIQGICVGHQTMDHDCAKTGVTVVIPSKLNIFKNKLLAACNVINGFGKSIGTVQIEELGTLETPIAMTNTLSTGIVTDALVQYMLENNPDIGLETGTVNPVVCECNDGNLNHIRKSNVKQKDLYDAIENAKVEFLEGDVGAGKGMRCLGLKGGIGTSSRVLHFDEKPYHVGALVLSNFGTLKDLVVDGIPAGKIILNQMKMEDHPIKEQGSIITLIATDIPLSERQLKRMAKRASIGIIRTGGYIASGSGEIAFAFTTANQVSHEMKDDLIDIRMLHEDNLNLVFRAVADSVEESILNSMVCAKTTVGRDGNTAISLSEYMEEILKFRQDERETVNL